MITVAPRLDVPGDERVQRGGGPVAQDRHPAPAVPTRLPDLYGHAHQGFLTLGPPAGQPRLLTADVGFVHLDCAGQPVPAQAHQHRTQPVQHRPRRLVRADLQRPLQAQRRDPVLLRREHPAGREPHGQRGPPPVEQRPGRDRGPRPAACALVAAIGDGPPAEMPAVRADEAFWPAQPVQVVQAVSVRREPGLELPRGTRVAPACPGCPEIIHPLRLVRSDGYP